MLNEMLNRFVAIFKCKNNLQSINGDNNIQAKGDINIYTGEDYIRQLPEVDVNYIKREDENLIINKLKTEDILVVYAVSGMGKSAISIAVANEMQKEFDKSIFISGNKLAKKIDDMVYKRCAYSESLKSLLVREKTLLVIDDLEENITDIYNEFKKYNLGDSRILITSKTSKYIPLESIFELKHPTIQECKKIISNGLNESAVNEDLCCIIRKVSYIPLLLKLINKSLIDNSLNLADFKKDVDQILAFEDENKNVKIVDRLLNCIEANYANELKIIKWLDSIYCDAGLLKEMIGIGVFRTLQSRAIFDSSESVNPYTVKLHEIILSAIKLRPINSLEKSEIEGKFIDYFTELTEGNMYFNALFMHKKKVLELCEPEVSWGKKLYLFLKCTFDSEICFEKIDKLSIPFIGTNEYNDDQFFMYISIVEYMERKLYVLEQKDESMRSEWIKECLETYNSFLKNSAISSKLKLILLHHIGKMYFRNGQIDLAKEFFMMVLADCPNQCSTKLQLIRIYLKEGKISLGKKYINEILEPYFSSKISVETTVLLATLNELHKSGLEEEFKKYIIDQFDKFKNCILNSSNFYFDQPFRVFINIGKSLQYEYPNLYLEIARSIPIKINTDIEDDKMLFNIGEYYKSMYMAENQKSLLLLDEAAKYYEKIKKMSDYYLKSYAQIYFFKRDFNKELEILDKITDKENAFVCYEYSKAKYEQNEFVEALNYIDKAIAQLELENLKLYFSAFYSKKGDILYSQKNGEWSKWYDLAIKKCRNQKYSDELRKKYQDMSLEANW